MATRDTDSYIFRKGISPNTLTVISSKNRIFAVNSAPGAVLKQIGVISAFDPSESRTIEPIRGIGFGDHIAELVPGNTEPMTISVTRTALYTSNMFQVFGYKAGIDGIVRSLRHHRWPFDIRQEIVFSRLAFEGGPGSISSENTNNISTPQGEEDYDEVTGPETQALVTLYEACWIADYNTSYTSDTAMVQETVTINVSDILNGTDFAETYLPQADYDQLALGENGLSTRLGPS